VVVIGQAMTDKLLEGVDPIGKEVRIGGIPYRIIGTVEKQGTCSGFRSTSSRSSPSPPRAAA
jgi:putative ABC transport system permease protein